MAALRSYLSSSPATALPAWQWMETILLTLLALGTGFLAAPQDPLLVHAVFPWLWIAPWLLALRYGVLSGIGSALLLILVWVSGQQYGWLPDQPFPKIWFLGGLIVTMILGEYSGLWRTRQRRLDELNHYLDNRIEKLTSRYYLLQLSHERLEQDLVSRPITLREALTRLRAIMTAANTAQPLPGADDFLALLAHMIQITTASLIPLRNGVIAADAAARLGSPVALVRDDPLITHALDAGELTHLNMTALERAAPSRYLIVAPLRASDGAILGLLAVEQMPFFALNPENLQVLTALSAYYADSANALQGTRPVCLAYPDCPPEFADELARLIAVRKVSKMDSALIALSIPDTQGALVDPIHRLKRELDVVWHTRRDARELLVTLMPLSGRAAADGYLARISHWLREHRQADMAALGVHAEILLLDGGDAVTTLRVLMSRFHA